MNNLMKEVLHYVAEVLIIVLFGITSFITINENKKLDDARYKAIVTAFEQVNEGFEYQKQLIDKQNKLIEQYKRDCENITSKVINGEW